MKVLTIQENGRAKWCELPEGGVHSHSMSDVVGLVGAVANLEAGLGGKADVDHSHPASPPVSISIADVIGLQAALDLKRALAATISSSDVVGLQALLDGKQGTSSKGQANGYAGLGSTALVPVGQLGSLSASSTTVLCGDGAWRVPSGGSDPWSYVRLTVDASISSATAVSLSLAFTPLANQRYEFEGQVYLRTTLATVNPRLGLAWSTGLTDGVASIDEAQTASTILMARGNINAALLVAVGGLPNTTQSWPATVWGSALAGSNPSGGIAVQLASETAGTTVVAKAGSFLKYRTIT